MGFNPCFTGTSSHTLPTHSGIRIYGTFQSLFYWNLLSYFQFLGKSSKRSSVSILVLLEPPLIRISFGDSLVQFVVSILVLLEPPLIRAIFQTTDFWKQVSILVLLEPPLILKNYIVR